MLKALLKTYKADTSVAAQDLQFELAGDWFPVRHDEWYNRLPGKHSQRARSSCTKMTYNADGTGSGWVGEVYVDVRARAIAPGRYTSEFKVRTSAKTLPWSASDGHLALLDDGTLHVQYPSHGIREYWRRAYGRSAKDHRTAEKPYHSTTKKQQRTIRLVFRHFGDSHGATSGSVLWHWGLSIDDSIYEVNGAMAVMGPHGIVATSSPLVKPVRTNLKDFHGFVDLPQLTRKTDEDIEEFTCRWVKLHPIYRALGPNCQTYAEDLFSFLTGEDLPFAKAADRVVGQAKRWIKEGPEMHPDATWLVSNKKPS